MMANDPALYRQMQEPHPANAANPVVAAFFEDLYQLRKKHRIAQAACVVMLNTVDDDGNEGHVITSFHAGNEMYEEQMFAWALGRASSDRQQRIAQAVRSAGDALKR